jgi:hypothetical protein
MADLNALIAQGAQFRPPPDPFAQYAQMQQLQQGQQANQLNQLKMQEYQRESAATNALNQAYQAAYNPATGAYDMNQLRGAVIGAGAGAKLPGIEEGMSKLRTQQFAQGKAETELADAKLKQARSFLDTINPDDPNAPQQYIAWHEANHRDPVLGPLLAARGVTADQSRARIAQAIQRGPQAFAELLTQSKLGTEKFIELNKPSTQVIDQSGQRQVVQIPGLGGTPTTVGTYADVPLPANVEAQKARIALAGRTPAQPREPREPSAPVAVVDDVTGKVKYVTREEAVGKTPANALEGLAPKEIQKREAAYPQATSAVKGHENKSDLFIRDLEKLRDDPGLENITGMLYGRTGSLSAAGSRAQALYDKVIAKGGFQALQDLRDASKTGGALGNVSNQEGKQLTASFAAIDRRQSAADVRAAIDQAIADIEGSKTRVREAYDSTYQYKQGSGQAPAAAPKPPGVDNSNPLLK